MAGLQCLGIPCFGTDARIVDPITFDALPKSGSGKVMWRLLQDEQARRGPPLAQVPQKVR